MVHFGLEPASEILLNYEKKLAFPLVFSVTLNFNDIGKLITVAGLFLKERKNVVKTAQRLRKFGG